ncbi:MULTISPECIES: AAA family ATPase [Pseudescherichia]|uniref:AAA family ATPase n=1 Tax=Pseudescherichia TaxID=2055880 RepID=UPI001EE02A01|nr:MULTISPECIES: AAA family ATPase [Pseudescherichia]
MDTLESIKLKSITLNNIRRFGSDVQINFGSGATIFIAPNGSGKTAVLEAIELALTSEVKRLQGRWAPLIRDGGNEASVKINFGDWQREVSVTKESVSIINEGNLKQIFSDTNPEEIPFLLRLTHLLDQRDGEWFCHQRSEKAGGQLAMLPLSRQASQINSTVARLRPAVARRITELKIAIESKQKVLDDWNALLRIRDSAQTDLSKPLPPLALLNERLEEIINTPLRVEAKSVAAIREQWAIANTINNQRLVSIETTLGSLAELVLVPINYSKISESLESLQQKLQTSKLAQSEYQDNQKVLSKNIESAADNHRRLNGKLSQLISKLERKRTYEEKLVLLNTQRQMSEELIRSFEQKKAIFVKAQEYYSAALTATEVNDILESLSLTIAQNYDELTAARKSYKNWCDAELRKQVEEKNLNVTSTNIASLEEELRGLAAEVERANSSYHHAKSVVSAYQDAVGAIRAAVSTVAEKLPVGTSACPVCLEVHGEQKLRSRISEALKVINPHLEIATLELHSATKLLETLQRKQYEKNAELIAALAARARINEALTVVGFEIATARSDKLLVGNELSEIQKRLDFLQKKVDGENAELNVKRAVQEPLASVEDMTQLATHYNSAKRDLAECEEAVMKMNEVIRNTSSTLNELECLVVKEMTIEQLEQMLKSLEEEVQLSAAEIEEAQAKKSTLSRLLLDTDISITRTSQQLELEKGHLEALLTKWLSAKLLDPPSNEQLENTKEKLLQDKTKADEIRLQLSDIEMELNRIAEANALMAAQQEVDAVRGKLSESKHTQLMMESLKNAQDEYALSSQRKNALDEFHLHLTTGIEKIRDKIVDVVPHWQAILRRIVQEPRFSGTSLKYYQTRAKDHASIQVGLGDSFVGAADVASQAQMTDLQLSFMLSMATIHKWSPWKALLLDDPTQHHDLVHASSVFDVLRDFIAELGFQVVLTTHDAQQARFLMRKLSNDGIDARLWTLEPSQDGMTAKQIGGIL